MYGGCRVWGWGQLPLTDICLSVFTADLLMILLAEIVAVYPQERPMFYTLNDGQYGVLTGV